MMILKQKKINELLSHFKLKQIIDKPTHYTNRSQTLIDVICTDARTRKVVVDRVDELGHHAFLTCEILLKKDSVPLKRVVYRPLNDIIPEYFETDLASISWHCISNMGDVNEMVHAFNATIIQIFDLHAPIKTIALRDRGISWITENIQLMVRLRNEARA